MTTLCDRLGMDPLEFRRKNHAADDQTSTQGYSSKHLLECYDKMMELSGLPAAGPLPVRASWALTGPGAAAWAWPARPGEVEVGPLHTLW